MKTWNQLFNRHGWRVEQKEENVFSCKSERRENIDFLIECLNNASILYTYENEILEVHSKPVLESKWIEAVDFRRRGRGEGLFVRSELEEVKVRELDIFICGIVRQLNRLGFHTIGSCDGHEQRAAHVLVKKDKDINILRQLFQSFSMKRVSYIERRNHYSILFSNDRSKLLDLAEQLSCIEHDWLEKGLDYIKEQQFYTLLENLLSIRGESGNEGTIRGFVKKKLTPFVDHVATDRYGNLLAEKTYRSGNGPTILLNAHLDTVCGWGIDRVIQKQGSIWSSSEGILGADDRAGVAILLHIAEYLHSSSFNGKVKFIFTVEEECGLVGATHVDEFFLWGTDAAVVVDRRGSGDIVTSCGGYTFCDVAYGAFFEKVAKTSGLFGWKTTNGGSSDTRIWASHGIQSVNLSAGYQHEHTEDETLDIEASYQVTKLLKGFFEESRELRNVLRGIERQDSSSAS